MAIKLGGTIINKKLLGVNKLNKIMLGTLEIFPNLVPAPAITVVGEFPAMTVGTPITPFTFTAIGGTSPYTFTEIGGMPDGLALSSAGQVSGTPTLEGGYSTTIEAIDQLGFTGDRLYTGTVAPAAIDINIAGDFPAGMTVGTPIAPFSFTASGGTGPYTFSVQAGAMPDGLVLASSGQVTGTPTTAGGYDVTIDATDSLANNGYVELSGSVAPAAGSFTPADLFDNDENGAWYDYSDIATMFQDANGKIPITGTDQPIGLILDKSKRLALLGEITADGGFDNPAGWTLAAGMEVIGGQLVLNSAAHATSASNSSDIAPTVRKAYRVTVDIVSVSQGTLTYVIGGAQITLPASGQASFTVAATGAWKGAFTTVGVTSAVIASHSVKLIAGNPYVQETAAKRPLYQSSGGLHWMLTDPIDDGGRTVIFTGNGDILHNVFGIKVDAGAGQFVPTYTTESLNTGFWCVGGNGSGQSAGLGTSYRANGDIFPTADASVRRNDVYQQLTLENTVVTVEDIAIPTTLTGIAIGTYPNFQLAAKVFGYVLLNRPFTTQERDDTEQFIAGKTGVTLP